MEYLESSAAPPGYDAWYVQDPSSNKHTATSRFIHCMTGVGTNLETNEHRQIKYSGEPEWVIDTLAFPMSPSADPSSIFVEIAFNKGDPDNPSHPGDLNPNKIPFRDIMLSFWQNKTGKSVEDLNVFKYWMVQEKTMSLRIPGKYPHVVYPP